MEQSTKYLDGLLGSLKGVDLGSADGRAGLGALLREIDQAQPGTVRRICAKTDLQPLEMAFRADR